MGALLRRIEQLKQDVPAQHAANVRAAAELFADELRRTLSIPGSPKSRSRPGEAPRRQSGRLVNSIEVRHSGDQSTVSVEAPHASALEHGTGRIAPRPYFSTTWSRIQGQVSSILARRSR